MKRRMESTGAVFFFFSFFLAQCGHQRKQRKTRRAEQWREDFRKHCREWLFSFLFVCFFMNEALERFGLLIRPGLFILMAIFPCLLRKRAGRPNQQRSLELNVHYVDINSTFPLEKNFCAIAPIQEEQNHLQRAFWRSVRIRGSSHE